MHGSMCRGERGFQASLGGGGKTLARAKEWVVKSMMCFKGPQTIGRQWTISAKVGRDGI